MLMEQTIEKMISMKMGKMAESLRERITRPDHQSLSLTEFIGFLVDDEYQHRQNQKLTSRMRKASFKETQACVENIDYQMKRDLTKKTVLDLAQNHWIRNHQNLIFTGPAGAGKSYLAQALGNHAVRAGFTVLYMRCPKLYHYLSVARADGSYLSKLKAISKAKVIILDDFGVTPMDEEKRQDLFEMIEDRQGIGSTIVTTQLPTDKWHQYLGGGMLGDSICDRLSRNAHKIKLTGDSNRPTPKSLTS
jgi:DNA replication protein DnaC